MVTLQPSEVVDKWTVVKTLGQGAFGAVYEVSSGNGSKNYALKCENGAAKVRVLKMEVVVLQLLQKTKAQHCCEIVDAGKARGFFYIVMTLIGKSLGELRKTYKSSKFTMPCAISVSMQCLAAIQELHSVGYLHRDLKPANFAISLDNPRKVVILDFGMCRKYIEGVNVLRKPRSTAGFRGTLRYASLRCHDCFELSRKDDLESWIYQTIELTSGSLPWSHLADINKVSELKVAAREKEKMKELFGGCPKEYLYMMLYVDGLSFYEDPKYSVLRGLLRDALVNNKLDENGPYDWEGSGNQSKVSQITKN